MEFAFVQKVVVHLVVAEVIFAGYYGSISCEMGYRAVMEACGVVSHLFSYFRYLISCSWVIKSLCPDSEFLPMLNWTHCCYHYP